MRTQRHYRATLGGGKQTLPTSTDAPTRTILAKIRTLHKKPLTDSKAREEFIHTLECLVELLKNDSEKEAALRKLSPHKTRNVHGVRNICIALWKDRTNKGKAVFQGKHGWNWVSPLVLLAVGGLLRLFPSYMATNKNNRILVVILRDNNNKETKYTYLVYLVYGTDTLLVKELEPLLNHRFCDQINYLTKEELQASITQCATMRVSDSSIPSDDEYTVKDMSTTKNSVNKFASLFASLIGATSLYHFIDAIKDSPLQSLVKTARKRTLKHRTGDG